MNWVSDAMIFLIPIVGSIALFSFLAVVGWAENRRKEREAYYRFEFRKKLVDAGEMNASHVQELMRYEYETDLQRRRHGLIIGGFITGGVGAGLLLGLQFIRDEAVWMVGFIPLFIGAAMLAYALVFAPRTTPVPPPGAFPRDPAA